MAELDRKTRHPTEIKLHQKSRMLEISFADRNTFRLSCEFLRRMQKERGFLCPDFRHLPSDADPAELLSRRGGGADYVHAALALFWPGLLRDAPASRGRAGDPVSGVPVR